MTELTFCECRPSLSVCRNSNCSSLVHCRTLCRNNSRLTDIRCIFCPSSSLSVYKRLLRPRKPAQFLRQSSSPSVLPSVGIPKITGLSSSLFYFIFLLKLLICFIYQACRNSYHNKHRNQSRNKTVSHTPCCYQGTNLIYQKSHRVTGT